VLDGQQTEVDFLGATVYSMSATILVANNALSGFSNSKMIQRCLQLGTKIEE
jgi:hypothetical protein